MEEIGKLVGALIPLLMLLIPLLFSRRADALKNRATEASTHTVSVETEGKSYALYEKVVERVGVLESAAAITRGQLNQQSTTIEQQADKINELNAAAVRHDNALDQANKDVADYKEKWKAALEEIKGCRAVAEQANKDLQDAFRRIDILETELRRLGGLSEQEENGKHIEQVIEDAKTLTDAPPEPPSE